MRQRPMMATALTMLSTALILLLLVLAAASDCTHLPDSCVQRIQRA